MNPLGLGDIHLALQMLDNIDDGIIVLDRDYKVCVWNTFMHAYSGIAANKILDKNLFDVVPELPEVWLKNKIESTFKLKTRSFTCWEDRPYIFKFSNFSPVSDGLPIMYQNMTLTPIKSLNGQLTHIFLKITDVSDIAKNKTHLRESNVQLSHLSKTDRLTQLYNRGHWENCLMEEFERCRQSNIPSTLVMFDIDHFKKVNDTYGHIAGDSVIRMIASLLLRSKRQNDIAGRYGGEEFGIVLPATDAAMSQYFSERLRKRVQEASVTADNREITVSISLGGCEWHPAIRNHEEWIELADKALYASKQSGRNQSSLYGYEQAALMEA